MTDGFGRLESGDFEGALASFQLAETFAPEKSSPLFYQGVALNRLARHVAAREALIAAEAKGTDNPDADFEVGWALAGSGRYDEARKRLLRYAGQNPGRAATRELLARLDADALSPSTDRPYQLSLRLSSGYNTNVLGQGDDDVLPAGLDSPGSWFVAGTLDLRMPLATLEGETLTAGLTLGGEHFTDIAGYDRSTGEASLAWTAHILPDVALRLKLMAGASVIGGEIDRSRGGLRVATRFELPFGLSIEPAWQAQWFDDNQNDPSAPWDDATGLSQSIELPLLYDFEGVRIRLSAAVGRDDMAGSDHDRTVPQLSLALTRTWQSGLITSISFVGRAGLHDSADSRAVPAFSQEREDWFGRISAQASYPIGDTVRVTVRADRVENGSNIPGYEYQQTVMSLALSVQM